MHLDNNPVWSAYLYTNYHRYHANLTLIEHEHYPSGFYLPIFFPERMQLILKEGREHFNIANTLIITNKKAIFQDFYFIWTTPENKKPLIFTLTMLI